jgi:pilus assembly protein CpaB
MIVLGVALGAGVLAAMLALNLSSRRAPAPAPVQTVKMATKQVLVAAKDIPTGTTLAADSVRWEEWPEGGVSGNFINHDAAPDGIEKVTGALARSTLYAGEPITEPKLIRTDRGFMSAILPQGKRAVAVRIAADTSAGGFILPNDRVDLVMTRASKSDGDSGGTPFRSETILNNVRVLAIDQTIEEKDGEKVVVGQTATLELSPEQVEILTVAQQMSERLTLALRSIADANDRPGETNPEAMHLIGGGGKKGGSVTIVKSGVSRQIDGIQ